MIRKLKLFARQIGYRLQARGWFWLAEVFHKIADERIKRC